MAVVPEADQDYTVKTRDVQPAHFFLRIESFSLLLKGEAQKYESMEFAAGDYNWKLFICPGGEDSENKDHVSIYLAMSVSNSMLVNWEVNAMFNIFLYNQILDNYLCFRGNVWRFHALKPKWGYSKLISKKCMLEPSNGYIVDDSCIFGAEVFIIKSERVIERLSMESVILPHKRDFSVSKFSKCGDTWYSEKFLVQDCMCSRRY